MPNSYSYDADGQRTLDVDCNNCASGVFTVTVWDDRTVTDPTNHCRCGLRQFADDYGRGRHAEAVKAAIEAADDIESQGPTREQLEAMADGPSADARRAGTEAMRENTRIGYSAGLQKIATLCDYLADDHRRTGHDISADVCAEHAALARALAALVEEAGLISRLGPDSDALGLVDRIADGFTAPSVPLTPPASDPR